MLIVGWTSLLYHFLHAYRISTQEIHLCRQSNSAPAQKTLYLFLIKSRRGKLQKICKGFSGLERSTACRARRRGSQFLTFCTKIGSSGVVKFYQKSIFQRIQARQRLFFLVFYVAKPKFQKGGGDFWGSRRLHLFGF